jgi:hypothetical protein
MSKIKDLLVTVETQENLDEILRKTGLKSKLRSVSPGKIGDRLGSRLFGFIKDFGISIALFIVLEKVLRALFPKWTGAAHVATLVFLGSLIWLIKRRSKKRSIAEQLEDQQEEEARRNAPHSESDFDKFSNTTTTTSLNPQLGFYLVRVIDHASKNDELFCMYSSKSSRGEKLGAKGLIEWLIDGTRLIISVERTSGKTVRNIRESLMARAWNRRVMRNFGASVTTDLLRTDTLKETTITEESGAAQIEPSTLRAIAQGSMVSVRVLGNELQGHDKEDFITMFSGFYRDNYSKQ